MPFLTCVSCGEVFEDSDAKKDKCPECALHSQLFDDIIADVASIGHTMIGCQATCTHLTPEEAGLKPTVTWQEDYEMILKHLHLTDVTRYSDFSTVIIAMGWKRVRVSPWHAIIIVTWLFKRNPSMCEEKVLITDEGGYTVDSYKDFHNPFRLLKTSHQGVTKWCTSQGKTFPELVGEAEKLLAEG